MLFYVFTAKCEHPPPPPIQLHFMLTIYYITSNDGFTTPTKISVFLRAFIDWSALYLENTCHSFEKPQSIDKFGISFLEVKGSMEWTTIIFLVYKLPNDVPLRIKIMCLKPWLRPKRASITSISVQQSTQTNAQ